MMLIGIIFKDKYVETDSQEEIEKKTKSFPLLVSVYILFNRVEIINTNISSYKSREVDSVSFLPYAISIIYLVWDETLSIG